MKVWHKLFIGVFAAMLCLNNASAGTYPCPAGCFCLNGGKYESVNQQINYESICSTPSRSMQSNEVSAIFCDVVVKNDDFTGSQKLENYDYSSSAFAMFVKGEFGGWGVTKEFKIEYLNGCWENSKKSYGGIFQCPEDYPHSDKGSKEPSECYRYDENGEKFYMKSLIDKVNTMRMKLLLLNQQKANDNSSLLYETVDTSNFDLSNLFGSNGASGGNGWIAGVVCQPGYYMPAGSTDCKLCTSNDKACPGGLFYVNKTYDVDRGTITCKNGVESNRKSCKISLDDVVVDTSNFDLSNLLSGNTSNAAQKKSSGTGNNNSNSGNSTSTKPKTQTASTTSGPVISVDNDNAGTVQTTTTTSSSIKKKTVSGNSGVSFSGELNVFGGGTTNSGTAKSAIPQSGRSADLTRSGVISNRQSVKAESGVSRNKVGRSATPQRKESNLNRIVR